MCQYYTLLYSMSVLQIVLCQYCWVRKLALASGLSTENIRGHKRRPEAYSCQTPWQLRPAYGRNSLPGTMGERLEPAKCEYIRFSRKRVKSQLSSYTLHQELIPQVKAIRYLRVHTQDSLKWHTHIDMITTKSSTTLGIVKKTIPPQSSQLRIRAYKQLVRPVLEFSSCSWDPLLKDPQYSRRSCSPKICTDGF